MLLLFCGIRYGENGGSYTKRIKKGDILQLSNGNRYYHSIIITRKYKDKKGWRYASHTYNHKHKPLKDIKESQFKTIRVIRIKGGAEK